MLQPGTLLNSRYEIHSVVGEGGMGAVYAAFDRNLGGKKVAVKEMTVNTRGADERARALEQFRIEARLLASLEHPLLVTVSDFFETSGNAYLVMAFIDGQTLASTVAAREVLMREVVDWMHQITLVLEYLHEHDPPVLFRDLKPSNVMLDGRGTIKLIDFGIARTFESGQSTTTFLKRVGTPEFAPVEQFSGRGTDVRSDIYSLGATMYNLLTAELPPIAVDVLSGECYPVSPRVDHPAIPVSLEAVLLRAMAILKENRYASAREMRLDIAGVRSEELTAPVIRAASPVAIVPGVPDACSPAPLRTDAITELSPPESAAALTPSRSRGIPVAGQRGGVALWMVVMCVITALTLGMLGKNGNTQIDRPVAAESTLTSTTRPSAAATAAQPTVAVSPTGRAMPEFLLRIESRPGGARVLVDDNLIMERQESVKTPAEIPLKPGRYRIQVTASGYEPFTTYVRIRKGHTPQTLSARLVPIVAQTPTEEHGDQ